MNLFNGLGNAGLVYLSILTLTDYELVYGDRDLI